MIFELARTVEQREVFLIRLHRQNQAFLRHGEEFGFELANVNGRPFHQRVHFIEQISVTRGRSKCCSKRRRFGFKLRENHFATHSENRFNFAVLTQQRFVTTCRIYLNIVCTLKAMTVRNATRFQAERCRGDHVIAVQNG